MLAVLLLSAVACDREPAATEEPASAQKPATTPKTSPNPPNHHQEKNRSSSGGPTIGGRVPHTPLRACCCSYMGQPRGQRGVEGSGGWQVTK